jgi:exonuclease-1
LLQALKRKGVEFIVAPYEADAQMAYLAINGLVDVVITEDSDLLTYGCPRVSCWSSRR